jgi:hypothetical protein
VVKRRDDDEVTGRYFLSELMGTQPSRKNETARPRRDVQEVRGLPGDHNGRIDWLCRQHYMVAQDVENLVDLVGERPEPPTVGHPWGREGSGIARDLVFLKGDITEMRKKLESQTTRLGTIEASIDANTKATASSKTIVKVIGVITGVLIVAVEIAWGAHRSGAFSEPPPVPVELQERPSK